MTTIARPSRAAFRFSGPDAQKLLNDVVTCRIVAEPGPARWFALLSPQGKIQAEGLAGYADGAFWLDVDAAAADEFYRKMRMYKLRADLTIEDLRSTHRVGWSPDGNASGIVQQDARGIGARVIAEDTGTWLPTDDQHPRARIDRGVIELGADLAADFPHDIGMDQLDGIDFLKGCYIGQEVVSRMKHRGTARRRPVIVSGIAAPGPLMAGTREVGTAGPVVGDKAVAIVRLDRIEDPAAVTAGGRPVTLTLPDWATYRFGESAAAE